MGHSTHGVVVLEGRIPGTKSSFLKRLFKKLFRIKDLPDINQVIREWKKDNLFCNPIGASIAFRQKQVLVAITYKSIN